MFLMICNLVKVLKLLNLKHLLKKRQTLGSHNTRIKELCNPLLSPKKVVTKMLLMMTLTTLFSCQVDHQTRKWN